MSEGQDKDLELVKQAAISLGEHFDSVQIFCTRHESGEQDGTVTVKYGTGNWFARYGQIKDWVLVEEESSKSKIVRRVEY
jgi:hypothetical protein